LVSDQRQANPLRFCFRKIVLADSVGKHDADRVDAVDVSA
jgi:hypothetical protein